MVKNTLKPDDLLQLVKAILKNLPVGVTRENIHSWCQNPEELSQKMAFLTEADTGRTTTWNSDDRDIQLEDSATITHIEMFGKNFIVGVGSCSEDELRQMLLSVSMIMDDVWSASDPDEVFDGRTTTKSGRNVY